MARVPLIEQRTDVPAGGAPAWDAIAGSRGDVIGPFRVLLHSPELARRVAEVGAFVRFESSVPAVDRELAILVAARTLDCRFEWAAHAPLARRAGVREEAIAAVAGRRAPRGLTATEAEVFAYTVQLLRDHRVEPAAFAALRDRLGLRALVELNTAIGYYGLIAATLNAFEVEPGPDADRLPA
jgi:4-carboxymuconolactone decarboxylase